MEKEKKNISKIIISIIALVLVLAVLVVLCIGYAKKATTKIQNPIVTMEVEDYGTIKIELYPDKAPNTVTNFIKLANNGFYNGLKFHRVMKDFMIQGGDSSGDGSGSAKLKDLYQNEEDTAYSIEGEFNANGHRENDLNLTEGTIAMARADYTQYSPSLAKQSYNSAGTQFFIMTTNNNTNLSGHYAGFGKVIEGMDVVKKIAEVKVKKADNSEETGNTEESVPQKDVKIKSVTVETFGMDYGFPQTMTPFNYMNWLYSQYGISQ